MSLYEKSIKIKVLNNEVFLDCECWNCEGKEPSNSSKNEEGNCEYCNGTGFIPTDNGREILNFIKRHLK